MVTRLDQSTPASRIKVDVGLRQRPQTNLALIAAKSKPTIVANGIYQTYSLPISNFTNDDEYIFFTHSVPRRWDGKSDITYGMVAVIDTANSTKKFSLRLDWEHFTSGAILPATANSCSCQITVAASSEQYQTYNPTFTIDYDIDGAGNEIKAGEIIAGKIGRVAASDNEVAGEILIFGQYLNYRRDKIGVDWS